MWAGTGLLHVALLACLLSLSGCATRDYPHLHARIIQLLDSAASSTPQAVEAEAVRKLRGKRENSFQTQYIRLDYAGRARPAWLRAAPHTLPDKSGAYYVRYFDASLTLASDIADHLGPAQGERGPLRFWRLSTGTIEVSSFIVTSLSFYPVAFSQPADWFEVAGYLSLPDAALMRRQLEVAQVVSRSLTKHLDPGNTRAAFLSLPTGEMLFVSHRSEDLLGIGIQYIAPPELIRASGTALVLELTRQLGLSAHEPFIKALLDASQLRDPSVSHAPGLFVSDNITYEINYERSDIPGRNQLTLRACARAGALERRMAYGAPCNTVR